VGLIKSSTKKVEKNKKKLAEKFGSYERSL
jgi:hypothetical protein